jgi:CO dehydrogenase maturation factor
MGHIVALAGKGGTGKTTIAALCVRLLKEKGKSSILAVDADPNSNLAELLGVKQEHTIGDILDEVAKNLDKIPSGMTKERFLEYQIQTAVQEGEGFDVLSMGRPEGPGCYCYVNNVLRNLVGKLLKEYEYIIIDNEAGLEHLSRRTTRSAETLLVVSDATAVGLKAARRIYALAKELNIQTTRNLLLVNRYDHAVEEERIQGMPLRCIGNIPFDAAIEELAFAGTSVWKLKDNAISYAALRKIGDVVWQ